MMQFKPPGSITFLLLTMLFLATACQSTPPADEVAAGSAEPITAEKADVPGVRNFTQVGPNTGFGGATQPSAMPILKEKGFATVINLRLESESDTGFADSRAAAEAAGLEYVHLPFDTSDMDPQLIPDFLATVDDPARQPVYVHCGSATRVAALWMIKRVQEDGWTIEQASREAEAIAGKPPQAIAFAENYLSSVKQ